MRQRLLVAKRAGDGLVHIGATDHPFERLQLLQANGVELEQHFVTRATQHACRILLDLSIRFRARAVDPQGPWYVIDYAKALAALGEYDLDTGERVGAGAIRLHSTVSVEGLGIGKVTGFSLCGRVEVTYARSRHAALITYAPASMVSVVA